MSPLEPIESKLWVMKAPATTTSERIEWLAMERFKLEVIFRTRWRVLAETRELDKLKVDLLFGLGYSRVRVQVKGATLNKDGRWGPHIFPSGKSLDLGFYEGGSSYLGLVLFHCSYWEFGEMRVYSPGAHEVTVLMLHGSKVIEFFEPREKSYGGRMRFSKKEYEKGGYGWLEGTEDLEGIFAREHERQEEEAAWLNERRKERER